MKAVKFYLLILIVPTWLVGMSHAKDYTFPDSVRVYATRTLDKIAPNSFRAIFELNNLSQDSLRGFYYADYIHSQFSVITDSVILNGKKYTNFEYEKDQASGSENNCILHRWILEIPGGSNSLSKQGILPHTGSVKIYYSVNSSANGSYHFPGYSWVGALGFRAMNAVFGYCDTALVTAVPVELASFSGRVNDGKIELTWTTASESNNYGFEVLKACDGKNFQNIGFVTAIGNSSTPQTYSFVDRMIAQGYYFYRLKQIDIDGTFEYSPTLEIRVAIPLQFRLEQNVPNPFNPATEIAYYLSSAADVRLVIFNLLGEEIRTLVQARQTAGEKRVTWDARDNRGIQVGSGLYLYRLEVDGSVLAHNKMLLLR